MIVDEYKSGATIIKFDDKYIGTKEENEEILDILLNLTIKKFPDISEWFVILLDKINKGRRYFGRSNI